ncbi:hypothetical protein, partial [Streptomyces lonegramiae]
MVEGSRAVSTHHDEQGPPDHHDEQDPPEPGVGPVPDGEPRFRPYHHPAAGWGAAESVTRFLARERSPVDGPR